MLVLRLVYCLRVNNDKWPFQNVLHPSLVSSKSIIYFAAPNIWNSYSLSLREIDSVSLFKARLESHFFNIAFEDVATA